MYSLSYKSKRLIDKFVAPKMHVRFGSSMTMALATMLALASPSSQATEMISMTQQCESLKGQLIAGAKISDAVMISPSNGHDAGFCKLMGRIHGTLGFEIHLPEQWNNKLVYAGGGGMNGAINAFTVSPSGNSGYALVASDGGHQANVFDASWALDNPKALQDYAYLSIHSVLQAANVIVPQYYGSPIKKRYFEGCSNGGREALISATRFPHDFDGIVARAPAWNITKLMLSKNHSIKQQLSTPDAALTTGTLETLGNAIIAKCDAQDGLKDGIVSNPAICAFDPAVLRCKAEKSDQCLTDGQIKTVNTIFSPTRASSSTAYYPGWRPSGVEGDRYGLGSWLVNSVPLPYKFNDGGPPPVMSHPHSTAQAYILSAGVIGNMLLGDPHYDTLLFQPEDHRQKINLLSGMLDATPDLNTFFALGNKLILWHGTGDPAISDLGSIQYFNAVADSVGGAGVRDAAMEFFLAPGVGHCGGGTGPDKVDLLQPLATWVEEGKRPSHGRLVTSKVDVVTGKIGASRPLCRYPAYPRYVGRGDPDNADHFVCTLP